MFCPACKEFFDAAQQCPKCNSPLKPAADGLDHFLSISGPLKLPPSFEELMAPMFAEGKIKKELAAAAVLRHIACRLDQKICKHCRGAGSLLAFYRKCSVGTDGGVGHSWEEAYKKKCERCEGRGLLPAGWLLRAWRFIYRPFRKRM